MWCPLGSTPTEGCLPPRPTGRRTPIRWQVGTQRVDGVAMFGLQLSQAWRERGSAAQAWHGTERCESRRQARRKQGARLIAQLFCPRLIDVLFNLAERLDGGLAALETLGLVLGRALYEGGRLCAHTKTAPPPFASRRPANFLACARNGIE